MQSRKSVKLATAVSVVAIVQAVVWILLSILGILAYFGVFSTTAIIDYSHYKLYQTALYSVLYAQDEKMIAILVVYMVLSIMWMSTSVSLIMSCKKNQSNKIKTGFLSWGGITMLICLFDIIALGLLAKDYTSWLKLYNVTLNPTFIYFLLAYGTLFSLAARGYVLWVINLALAVIVIKHAKGSKMNNNYVGQTMSSFDEGRRGSFPRGGQPNQSYEPENSRPPFNQSSSYASSLQGGHPMQRPYTAPSKPQNSNMYSKPNYYDQEPHLGRQEPRLQAPSVAPKPGNNYIYPGQQFSNTPSPDYSPPISPMKSAMKTKQMQNPYDFNRPTNNRY